QAWLADPRRTDDHPWRDLMRIAHAEGDGAQVRTILHELLRWRDAEDLDELSPATQRLVAALLEGRDVGVHSPDLRGALADRAGRYRGGCPRDPTGGERRASPGSR